MRSGTLGDVMWCVSRFEYHDNETSQPIACCSKVALPGSERSVRASSRGRSLARPDNVLFLAVTLAVYVVDCGLLAITHDGPP